MRRNRRFEVLQDVEPELWNRYSPDIQEKILLDERRRLEHSVKCAVDSKPLLQRLSEMGFNVERISDLYEMKLDYRAAIPLLIEWLPRIDNLAVKEMIARCLTWRYAKPHAAPVLIQEFKRAPDFSESILIWVIGSALEIVADDGVFEEIAELASNKRYGRGREMLARALGKMNDPRAEDVLLDLIDDEEICTHAMIGLKRLRCKRAIPKIKKYLDHPESYVRKLARQCMEVIPKPKRNSRRKRHYKTRT
jgi:HEAT repeat protein